MRKQPYITGTAALDISGNDWHQSETYRHFKNWFIAGVNYPDTWEVFGDLGLYDATEEVRKGLKGRMKVRNGILCADGVRTFLDMVWNSIVVRKREPYFTLESFLYDQGEERAVIEALKHFREAFPEDTRKVLDAYITKLVRETET